MRHVCPQKLHGQVQEFGHVEAFITCWDFFFSSNWIVVGHDMHRCARLVDRRRGFYYYSFSDSQINWCICSFDITGVEDGQEDDSLSDRIVIVDS